MNPNTPNTWLTLAKNLRELWQILSTYWKVIAITLVVGVGGTAGYFFIKERTRHHREFRSLTTDKLSQIATTEQIKQIVNNAMRELQRGQQSIRDSITILYTTTDEIIIAIRDERKVIKQLIIEQTTNPEELAKRIETLLRKELRTLKNYKVDVQESDPGGGR